MPNPKSIPHGAVVVTAANRDEYLATVSEYEALGYRFSPCDDLKRLHWAALGIAGSGRPLVWVRTPILEVVGEADEGDEVGAVDGCGRVVTCGTLHLGDRIEEVTTDLFNYQRAFRDHKDRQHHVLEASDPLTYRLAFVCTTCARLVKVDWDQCIDLGATLEHGVKEAWDGGVSYDDD